MVERRLAEVYCSRKLYAGDQLCATPGGKTAPTKHHFGKNQISVPLRIRLQSSCIELLCGRTDELLGLGRALFDSAQKLKTMGLDKHKLMLVLVEICNLSQVIVILLPLLLSSSAPSSSSSKSADYSLLAVDVERVMTLADSSLAALLDFLATNVPLLTTHPQLLHQLLQRLYSLVGSWAASRSGSPRAVASTGDRPRGIATRPEGKTRRAEGNDRTPRGSDASFASSIESASNPLDRYQHLLQPLTAFLISYLDEYCAAVQKQSKESQGQVQKTLLVAQVHCIMTQVCCVCVCVCVGPHSDQVSLSIRHCGPGFDGGNPSGAEPHARRSSQAGELRRYKC
jgi:hypothetical protein